MQVKIEESWKNVLHQEFTAPYFSQITEHLKIERDLNKVIFPPGSLIFNAFDKTPFDKLKVVILGQDPYHQPKQAMGLCFSVPDNVPPPRSLQNIFKELQSDIGMPIPNKGDLTQWAAQGVLLLNTVLTVRQSEPGSHSRIGWLNFTDAVIKKISDKKSGVVFLLWGKYAQEKKTLIDASKHFILEAAHPSPLSAHNGFFGCKHFSKTNTLLVHQGKNAIDWSTT
jgi:uracil-DNA glycosylase